jgi:hypothetical protein
MSVPRVIAGRVGILLHAYAKYIVAVRRDS